MRTIVGVLALCWATAASAANLDDAVQATCRISSANGWGTGVVTEVTGDYVGILTNAHVVGTSQTVKCEFWRAGFQSQPVEATVASKVENATVDAALVVIRASVFGGTTPKAVPIAKSDYVVKAGEEVASVGCPKGGWPTAFIGHATGYQGAHLLFTPPPADGRSGSALFNKAGEVVGLVFARDEQASVGLACTVQAMRAQLATDADKRGSFTYTGATKLVSWQPTQCGPQGCPPPATESFQYKFRQRQQPPRQQAPQPKGFQFEQQATPWPGFGDAKPETPPVDLGPILQKLDELKAAMPKPAEKGEMVPVPEKPAEPDPALAQAVKEVAEATTRNAVAIKGVDDRVTKVEDVVSVRLKAAEVKDAVLESPFLKHAAAVLAVLLVLFWGYKTAMQTGRGLVGTVVHRAAERHPENEKLAELDARLAEIGAAVQAWGADKPLGKALAAKAAPKPAAPAEPKVEPPATPAA